MEVLIQDVLQIGNRFNPEQVVAGRGYYHGPLVLFVFHVLFILLAATFLVTVQGLDHDVDRPLIEYGVGDRLELLRVRFCVGGVPLDIDVEDG